MLVCIHVHVQIISYHHSQFLEPISFDLLSCITLPLAEVLWQTANTCLVFVPLLTMGSIPVSAVLDLGCQTALKDS